MPVNYYRRFPGDYANDTRHLTYCEHGAYTMVMDYSYATEKPLPKDREEIYRKLCARDDRERAAIDTILGEFFTLTARGYVQKRITEEIRRFRAKLAAYRANGRKGGLSHKAIAKPLLSKPQASQNQNQNQNQKEQEKPFAQQKALSLVRNQFDEFWKVYPRKEGKRDAQRIWDREGHDGRLPELLAAIELWKRARSPGFMPYACRWLAKDHWKDAPVIEEYGGANATKSQERTRATAAAIAASRGLSRPVAANSSGALPARSAAEPDRVHSVPDCTREAEPAADGQSLFAGVRAS